MCVLCGQMMNSFHWSDLRLENENELEVGERQKIRLKARLQKLKFVNEILEFFGLKLRDFQGSKYILENKKGMQVIVDDLGDLWAKFEKLEKTPADALSEKLIAFLSSKTHACTY